MCLIAISKIVLYLRMAVYFKDPYCILFNNLAATKIIKSKPNAFLNLFKIFILHESVHITVCKIYKFPSLNMTRITAKQLRENL